MGVSMMHNIEKRLLAEREQLQSIQAPTSLEETLKKALHYKTKKKKRHVRLFIAAALIMLTILAGYNYNALAYYSKKILGFENHLSGTLKQLNEDGFGQSIDQSITLEDGTILTINGIISDENQLLLLYTLFNENGLEDSKADSIWLAKISGFMTNSAASGGSGSYNATMTELKMISSFEPVNPFAKSLTLHVWDEPFPNDSVNNFEITFKHDPNKAMQANMKLPLNETFEFDLGSITVQSITASPTMTMLEGRLKMEYTDEIEYLFYAPYDGLKLKANGNRYVSKTGSRRTTEDSGTTFEVHYDALPLELDSLELVLEHSLGYDDMTKEIDLSTQLETYLPIIDEREIMINDVNQTSQSIEITVATDDYMIVDQLFLKTATGDTVPVHDVHLLGQKMQRSTRLMNERTYIFKTQEQPDTLIIEGIYYKKPFQQTVTIPLKQK